ncbi:MAG: hypothetical protein GF409_06175 [Candidatus Omnitrophica bacterium]|nr:hypothetical protein [Candidatus Omnitrophota bacterium]
MRNLTETGARINSKIGKAIHDHQLIEQEDRILIAVSGGKDSLTMLTLLSAISTWAPVGFTLLGIYVEPDLPVDMSGQRRAAEKLFRQAGIDYTVRKMNVLDREGETSCFWCSWNRRKVIFQTAAEMRCNKVALGHHKDDIAETMLMNLLFNGEISAMNPKQEMFAGKITLIRPLCYVEEKWISRFARESGFPQEKFNCPFGEDSKRNLIKKFIRETGKLTPGINISTNIFNSISRIRQDYIALTPQEEQPLPHQKKPD